MSSDALTSSAWPCENQVSLKCHQLPQQQCRRSRGFWKASRLLPVSWQSRLPPQPTGSHRPRRRPELRGVREQGLCLRPSSASPVFVGLVRRSLAPSDRGSPGLLTRAWEEALTTALPAGLSGWGRRGAPEVLCLGCFGRVIVFNCSSGFARPSADTDPPVCSSPQSTNVLFPVWFPAAPLVSLGKRRSPPFLLLHRPTQRSVS